MRHETLYRYPGLASLAYNKAWLAPLVRLEQQVLEHRVRIDPKPRFQHVQTDSFGNRVHYFEVHKPHQQLKVTSEAVVGRCPKPLNDACQFPWEQITYHSLQARQKMELCSFAYPSPMAPYHEEAKDYAQSCFSPARPVAESLLDFAGRIYRDFSYESGATQVDTTLGEFLDIRKGVCQDFAHLAVSGLRSLGLVAAYVSGYVMTYPPEGEEKRQGADASHAWVALYVPDYGWLHVDPTNNMWVSDEHVIVAIGRDYSDVPPLKGVCYGAGQQQPEVAVTLERISREELSYGH
ncbi:transglutaminase family protein [Hahella ganghwensis]|uniref:transglutaminase family protein n=1 Tax=Hahella ganghwensis TaxID=286420 RepID=UPI00036770CB|nr:transglutaminase family protein [Hahella ganghwensis]